MRVECQKWDCPEMGKGGCYRIGICIGGKGETNMSYSFNNKCHACSKNGKCVDREFIWAAVYGINSTGYDKGHLGGGSITLECNSFIEANPTPERVMGISSGCC